MKHIKTPVKAQFHYKFNTDEIALWDRNGGEPIAIVPVRADQEAIAKEITNALNVHDDMLGGLTRAEQTIRNLALCGALEGDDREIALNEAQNLRRDIAKGRGEGDK